MRKLIFFLSFSVLILIGLFFGSINQQVAELNYFIAKAQLRVVDIALLFLVIGFAIGLSLSLTLLFKARTKRWLARTNSKT
ncbi:MAG: LapA family protein [Gammaproteobacteria bacterium]|nr:LapA family protein [Gammaproteobacteria bacterium]